MEDTAKHRCGFAAIIGRPNVGKSTLLNRVLGQQISITSRKPQTTRYQILGIKTIGESQIIYVDTPGLDPREDCALTRHMRRETTRAIADVDAIILVLEAMRWIEGDRYVLNRLRAISRPIILAINKVDKIADKRDLLPFIAEVGSLMRVEHVVPISGRTGDNIEALENCVMSLLPDAPHLFPEHQISDRNERFFAAEFIREKLTRKLSQEVPHRLGVVIDEFVSRTDVLHVSATIWVERQGQKRIVVGKQGEVLKLVGEQARRDMERMFGIKVFLRTWVKVKEKWSDDERSLRHLGFGV